MFPCFFCVGQGDPRDLHVLTHSFPTRRSSDLDAVLYHGTAQPAFRHRFRRAPGRMHMIAPFRLRRRARLAIARFTRDARATVLIEMAFAIPFLVLVGFGGIEIANLTLTQTRVRQIGLSAADNASRIASGSNRSEEHTSELQSLMRISYAVFFLKKKTK